MQNTLSLQDGVRECIPVRHGQERFFIELNELKKKSVHLPCMYNENVHAGQSVEVAYAALARLKSCRKKAGPSGTCTGENRRMPKNTPKLLVPSTRTVQRISQLRHDLDAAVELYNWQRSVNGRLKALLFRCEDERRPPTGSEISEASNLDVRLPA